MGCVWAAAPQGDLGGLLKGRSCWGRVSGGRASPGSLGEAGPLWGYGSIRVMLSVGASMGDRPPGAALPPQFMQKKSPLYVLLKEDTVWSMEHLNRYINDKFHKTRGLPRDWVFTTFTVCVCPAHSATGGGCGSGLTGWGVLGHRQVPGRGCLWVCPQQLALGVLSSPFLKRIIHAKQRSPCESAQFSGF